MANTGVFGAVDLVPVTQSDSVQDPALGTGEVFRGLIIGGAGIVKLTMETGQTRTLASGVLAVGVIHAMRFTRIWTTTTTATNMFGVI
jgi:hypothetical protein